MTPRIVEEFRKQYAILKAADAESASGRLVTIINWLRKEAVATEIIQKLIATVDEDKVFPEDRAAIAAYTREEIAFAGYTLMTGCRQHSFWRWCVQYGIRPADNSTNVNEITPRVYACT